MEGRPPLALDLFDYELPGELIAQRPAAVRAGSRLLHLVRATGGITHRAFRDFPSLLRRGDLLLLNDTRVFAARLPGRRRSGGKLEVFLTEFPRPSGEATCFLRPARRVKDGETVELAGGFAAVIRHEEGGFVAAAPPGVLERAVAEEGRIPLPPYIRREIEDPEDRERYQTVFARAPGAVAAPTAGLHFDQEILERIRASGVEVAFLTLHVGAGTFLPIRERDLSRHRMHEERYRVPPATAEAVFRVRRQGGRVVAAGTTVVRAIETAALAVIEAGLPAGNTVKAGEGVTSLFISPGFRFRATDALLTNFHLPRSSLLVMVAAFAGRERALAAYREAIAAGYRFFSYGDAMFVE